MFLNTRLVLALFIALLPAPSTATNVQCAWCTQSEHDALAIGDRETAIDAVARRQWQWLAANSGRQISHAQIPRIAFAPHQVLDSLYSEDELPVATYSQAYPGQPGMVFLRPEFDFSDSKNLSSLLHELVHAAQSVSGVNFATHDLCTVIPLEVEAINLQNAWHRATFGRPAFDNVAAMHRAYERRCQY
jgi:hypothetical protein